MNVKVEKQENSKVVLEFTMQNEEFKKELNKAFKKNARYFNVPGFRIGKVPMAIVEKMYGEKALCELVVDEVADNEYKKALEENKLESVSQPHLEIKEIGKDKDLVYTIEFYERPEAKVKAYKGLEIEKIDVTVTDEDVEKEINKARDNNARIVSVEDEKLKENDISTIDFEGFVDGVAFEGGKGENYELTIGSGAFIPGFEEQLIGMSIGEEREITVKFPDDYHADNLAGKDAMFKVKLNAIQNKILPELDDEFVKDVSEFDTLDDYKKDVKEKLEIKKQEHAKHEKESKVIEKLLENTEVVIPDSMIEDEQENILKEYEQNMSAQGLNLDIYCKYMGTTKDAFKADLKPQAENNVKIGLAFEAIKKQENIEVTDTEIEAKIDELVEAYKNEQDDVSKLKEKYMKNENIKIYMKEKIELEKLWDLVIDSAVEK